MSTLESVFKSSGFASEFAGYVWTEGVSRKKKLQIQKYPDTCGRGFILTHNNILIGIQKIHILLQYYQIMETIMLLFDE